MPPERDLFPRSLRRRVLAAVGEADTPADLCMRLQTARLRADTREAPWRVAHDVRPDPATGAADQPAARQRGRGARRVVPAAGGGLPPRALRAEPRHAARPHRRHARRARPVRRAPDLRGRRHPPRAHPRPRAVGVGERDHAHAPRLRAGHHRLGGRQPRAGAREPGASRPARRLHPRHAAEPEALVSIPLIARGSLKGALNIYRLGETARSTTTSSSSRSGSAMRRRSRSTTRRCARGWSTRHRPTR